MLRNLSLVEHTTKDHPEDIDAKNLYADVKAFLEENGQNVNTRVVQMLQGDRPMSLEVSRDSNNSMVIVVEAGPYGSLKAGNDAWRINKTGKIEGKFVRIESDGSQSFVGSSNVPLKEVIDRMTPEAGKGKILVAALKYLGVESLSELKKRKKKWISFKKYNQKGVITVEADPESLNTTVEISTATEKTANLPEIYIKNTWTINERGEVVGQFLEGTDSNDVSREKLKPHFSLAMILEEVEKETTPEREVITIREEVAAALEAA